MKVFITYSKHGRFGGIKRTNVFKNTRDPCNRPHSHYQVGVTLIWFILLHCDTDTTRNWHGNAIFLNYIWFKLPDSDSYLTCGHVTRKRCQIRIHVAFGVCTWTKAKGSNKVINNHTKCLPALFSAVGSIYYDIITVTAHQKIWPTSHSQQKKNISWL